MSQNGVGVDLDKSLGYLLKEASSALRSAMEEVLRPLGMSVTHYSCLELLAQRPGLSNSELARGAFVTRQTMNVLLQTLEREGFVTRPAEAPVGMATTVHSQVAMGLLEPERRHPAFPCVGCPPLDAATDSLVYPAVRDTRAQRMSHVFPDA
jgi:hypothetical protein